MQELRKIRFQSGSLHVEVYCNINKKTHDGKKGVFYKGKISCPAPGGGRAGTFRFETVDLTEFDHAARQAFVAGNLEPQSDESLASAARAVVRWTIDNGGKKWAPPLETARIFAAGVHVDERGTIVLTTAGESIQMMSDQVEFQVTAMKHADGHFSIPKRKADEIGISANERVYLEIRAVAGSNLWRGPWDLRSGFEVYGDPCRRISAGQELLVVVGRIGNEK